MFVISHRLLETRNGRHVKTGNDGHQRIEIANVETLSGHFDPIFNDFYALLLLDILQVRNRKQDKKHDPKTSY